MEGRPNKTSVFVSHVHEDRAVAAWLQDQLSEAFYRVFDVFVSSERQGHAGERWLTRIEEELGRCRVLVALCSAESIQRPWVNFELGAAWILEKKIIPVCHAGLTPERLVNPLSTWQGLTITEPDDLETLYETLGADFGFGRLPRTDFDDLAAQVPSPGTAAEPRDSDGSVDDETRDIRRRLRHALSARQKWRTIGALATEAAVDEEIVLRILRADEQVRFSRGKSGKQLAGLIERVGA